MLQYKRLFFREKIMTNQASQTQWIPIKENPKEWPDLDDFYEDRMENIGSQSLEEIQQAGKEVVGNYNPEREKAAAEIIAAEEKQEEPELDLEAAFWDKEVKFDIDNTDMTWKPVYETVKPVIETPIPNRPDYQVDLWESIEQKKWTIDETPYAPIIDQMSNYMKPEVRNKIKEGLANGQDIITVSENSGLDPEWQKQVVKSVKFIEEPKEIPKRQERLTADFWEKFKEFQGENWEWLGFWEEAFNLVAKNYLVTGSENQDMQATLNVAFQMAANTVIDWKQIKRTETFEKILEQAKNPNLSFSERFFALQGLLKITNQDQGVKGRKKRVEYERMKKQRDITQLEKEIQDLQYDIERAEGEQNKEKSKKLKEQQDWVREELDIVIKTGEADMWGWTEDVMAKWPSENTATDYSDFLLRK